MAENSIGDVSPRILQIIQQAKGRNQRIIQEIGNLELRKMQLVRTLEQIDADVKKLVDAEGIRLGVPEGVPWQITPEGKVVIMESSQQKE